MTDRKNPPTADVTVEEMVESLTGFDEIAIRRAFDGLNPYTSFEDEPMLNQRAMVFVHQRRLGRTDAEAKEFALAASGREVHDYFADADDDVMPDDPESESGKDEPSPVTQPSDSPSSAS